MASARGLPYGKEYEKEIVKRMQKKLSESVCKHANKRINTGMRGDDRDTRELGVQMQLNYTHI
jgi:hypothetical protein